MKKKILITLLVVLSITSFSYGQGNYDINNLIDTLKNKGYVVAKEDVKDIRDLEHLIFLDTKLKNRQNSIDSVFNSMDNYFRYLGNSGEDNELLKKIWTLGNISKNIKGRFVKKNEFYLNDSSALQKLINDFEDEINFYDGRNFSVYLEATIDELKRVKNKYLQDSIRVNKRKSEIASLPSKATIKTKFRTYTHKNGYVFEFFPVGFTPKMNKIVIDRVFGRKARYREVDVNGFNTFIIDFYDSGSIMNVTIYGGNGGNMIYYAEYRDYSKKPYEIRTYSADGKFYVVYKRIYDMYDDKIKITTKYQYVPLDYWYE